ncbi:hypothetical protein ACFWOX_24510 [Streptomyces sp. NPDC058467]
MNPSDGELYMNSHLDLTATAGMVAGPRTASGVQVLPSASARAVP